MASTPQLLDTTDLSEICDVSVVQKEFVDQDTSRVVKYNRLVLKFDTEEIEIPLDKIQRAGIYYALKDASSK
jgi:hypothetical protein